MEAEDITPSNRERELENELVEWRELLSIFYDILTWKTTTYCYLIISAISLAYVFHFYYLDLSAISTIAVILLELVIADFIITSPSFQAFNGNWNSDKQRKYEQVCNVIRGVYDGTAQYYQLLRKIKHDQPKLYLVLMVAGLTLMAMIGLINNGLVLYMITLGLAMLPGCLHHGVIEKYFGKFKKELKILLESKLLHQRKD